MRMLASKRSKEMYFRRLLKDARIVDRLSKKWEKTFLTSREIRARKNKKDA